MFRSLSLLVLFMLFVSCNKEASTPKPIGYNRIERTDTKMNEHNFSLFSFNYPSGIRIDTLKSSAKDELWFNIVYPQYNAVLHCTYLPISKDVLAKVLDDSYHLAYSHASKANGIEQKLYSNPHRNVSGILYEIDGNVATPIQFFVTDSIRHFLRGSFYYSSKVSADSVATVTEFVKEDIQSMMNSLRWKSAKQE